MAWRRKLRDSVTMMNVRSTVAVGPAMAAIIAVPSALPGAPPSTAPSVEDCTTVATTTSAPIEKTPQSRASAAINITATAPGQIVSEDGGTGQPSQRTLLPGSEEDTVLDSIQAPVGMPPSTMHARFPPPPATLHQRPPRPPRSIRRSRPYPAQSSFVSLAMSEPLARTGDNHRRDYLKFESGDAKFESGASHNGGKIEGGSGGSVSVRHGLMGVHFMLLTFSTVFTGAFLNDRRSILAQCALALAFLIYIPAAFGLTVARRKTHFDHAGGEIAYLVVQQVGWLVVSFLSYCHGAYIWIMPKLYSCQWASTVLGLSLSHVMLLLGWMIWVIVVAYRQSPNDPNRALQISTGWLLRGRQY